MRPEVAALIELACHSAACAPPPAGTGGSTKGKGGGRSSGFPQGFRGQDAKQRVAALKERAAANRAANRSGSIKNLDRADAADAQIADNIIKDISGGNRERYDRMVADRKKGKKYSDVTEYQLRKQKGKEFNKAGATAKNIDAPRVTSDTPKNHKSLTAKAKKLGLVVRHGSDGKYGIDSPKTNQSAIIYEDGSWMTRDAKGREIHTGRSGFPVFGPGRKDVNRPVDH